MIIISIIFTFLKLNKCSWYLYDLDMRSSHQCNLGILYSPYIAGRQWPVGCVGIYTIWDGVQGEKLVLPQVNKDKKYGNNLYKWQYAVSNWAICAIAQEEKNCKSICAVVIWTIYNLKIGRKCYRFFRTVIGWFQILYFDTQNNARSARFLIFRNRWGSEVFIMYGKYTLFTVYWFTINVMINGDKYNIIFFYRIV